MGWFNKKEKEESSLPSLPKLPELPKLPGYREFPEISKNNLDIGIVSSQKNLPDLESHISEIHELPSFPTTNFGEKFSQNTIKNAITGQKEDEEEEADDFEKRFQMMPEPLEKAALERRIIPLNKEMPSIEHKPELVKSTEPIFIRIDKFEESLKTFEKVKDKLNEIEKLLHETKEIKEKEETELNSWEQEIQKLKSHIEKVNEDIFSKIE